MHRRGKEKPEPSRQLERKFEGWAHRQTKHLEQDPEELLQQAQDVLRWSIRKNGPDSTFTIRAMNEVANQLSQLERVAEEISLREKIAEGLRSTVGPEHASTLNAEWKLATCLMMLDRPEDAEPLLSHVVAGRAIALGEDDVQTLAAVAWSANAAKKLGKLDEARLMQELVVKAYELREDSEGTQAQLAALNLASTLGELQQFDEAVRLVRDVVDVRTRTLGPEDPRTLDVCQALASMRNAQRHEARAHAADQASAIGLHSETD